MSDVEHQFDAAMYRVWQRAKDECNYNASYFLRMPEEMGGVARAKSLAGQKPLSAARCRSSPETARVNRTIPGLEVACMARTVDRRCRVRRRMLPQD